MTMRSAHYVVTGASTGMGAQFVDEVRQAGHTVTALDVADPTIEVDEYIRTDLSDPMSIAAAAAQVEGLDALINCAGIPADVATADVVLGVNFLGLRELTEALVPRISDGGSVLNIASIAGSRYRTSLDLHRELLETEDFAAGLRWYQQSPARDAGVYGFSKEAVWVYTMALASRLFSRRIRVNSVCPGLVQTQLESHFVDAMSQTARDAIGESTGRSAFPSEVTSVMRFLISQDAGWINAQNITVDGGYMAGMECAKW